MVRLARIWLVVGILTLSCGTAASVIAQQPEPVVHVVQDGDTLYSIAAAYGLTVEELATANGIEDTTLIAVGQELVIPLFQPEPEPTATRAPPIYVVQPGDTLSTIAERFQTTVEALVAANDIVDPALIEVGQKLVIPTEHPELVPAAELQPYRRWHPVRQGETLLSLAFRYGTTFWELREANDLGWLGLVVAGQDLNIPAPTAPHTGVARFPGVTVLPRPAVQGQTVVVEAETEGALVLTAQLLGQDLVFTPGEEGYWALAGVDPLTPPGIYALSLSATEGSSGDRLTMQETMTITAGSFGTYNIAVPAGRQGLLDPEVTASEAELVAEVFAGVTRPRMWDGPLGFPLEGDPRVTAQFGQRRSYGGGPVSSYHAGLDLGADKGIPIVATARGTVVLADKLQVRGRAVIIDHGLGVFTGFWHLSQIDVTVGQIVEPGDVVGLVGSSGLSTGPHLHWEMRVRGVPVDPVQWTERAFP